MNKKLENIVNNLDLIRQLYDKEVIISVERWRGGSGLRNMFLFCGGQREGS